MKTIYTDHPVQVHTLSTRCVEFLLRTDEEQNKHHHTVVRVEMMKT